MNSLPRPNRWRAQRAALFVLTIYTTAALWSPLPAQGQEPPTGPNPVYLPVVIEAPAASFNTGSCSCRQTAPSALQDGDPIPNQYVVLLADAAMRPGAGAQDVVQPAAMDLATEVAATSGGTLVELYSSVGGFAMQMTTEAAASLAADPRVASVEQDRYIALSPLIPAAAPDVTTLQTEAVEWALDRIDQRVLPLDGSFLTPSTGAGVHVYILDSGIRLTHSEFAGRIGSGQTFISDGYSVNDCYGHGTHVAASVGGASYGVAPEVTLHAVRVLNECGRGTTSALVSGIDWVLSNVERPAIINLSLGAAISPALDSAVLRALAADITVVAAAGNASRSACEYSPARVPAVLTVGASDREDYAAYFSNFGACVDLYAPGQDVRSAWNTSDVALRVLDGTSMAAPHVTGAAALFLQANPAATPAQVATYLLDSSTPGRIGSLAGGSPNRLLYVGTGAVITQPVGVNVLLNPGFEFQGDGWEQESLQGYDVICTSSTCGETISPHTGDWMAWLGGDNNEQAALTQTVRIPVGPAAQLRFFYNTYSADACGFDFARALVVAGGEVLKSWEYSLCEETNDRGWRRGDVVLEGHGGSEVQVVFQVTTDSSEHSSFWIDDVSLTTGVDAPEETPPPAAASLANPYDSLPREP